ncbi:XRE family transcriptional regulator [Bacillus sp. SA1-12]|nr:helix-turn-helix transcriptional regulator [Bacillus sp. SA1-12]KKI89536.1 XRE family transcriptional regulator [Bacillus sp. SA1-12]
MNFAEKLKKGRKEKGWSQEELAKKLFVSRQSVSKWENGRFF